MILLRVNFLRAIVFGIMALPPDRFQLVSLLGSSRFKASPLVHELAAAGMPLQTPSSFTDAVRACTQLASQLFCDEEQLGRLTPDLVAQLEVQQKSARLLIFVLSAQGQTPSRGNLILHGIAGGAGLEALLPSLVPRMLMHQRGTPRAVVTLNARFESGARDEVITGRVSSLSEGGVLFVSQTPPSLGETGMLTVIHDGGEWEVRATVVNERKMERGAGMKFESVSDTAREGIRHAVTLSLGGGARRDVKPRILSLDPSLLSSRLSEAIFRGGGYEVQLCHAPADAVKALANGKPDIVLLDHTAKAFAGERAKEIVRRAQGATVVLYSNADEAAVQAALVATGATHHVYKGTFADALVTRVSALLRS